MERNQKKKIVRENRGKNNESRERKRVVRKDKRE